MLPRRLRWRAIGSDTAALSLVFFGNILESSEYPISSIDFGFDRLACLAAHILIGDIPIRANQDGTIAGPCTCVDRGSVGGGAAGVVKNGRALLNRPRGKPLQRSPLW